MNQQNDQMKTPITLIMDMAKQEIGNHVIEVMQNNQIPAGLMEYILKGILLDISAIKINSINEEYINLQKEMMKGEEK